MKVPEVRRYPDGLAVNIDQPMGGDRVWRVPLTSRTFSNIAVPTQRSARYFFSRLADGRRWDEVMSFDEDRIAFLAMVKRFHSLVWTSRVGVHWLTSRWTDSLPESVKSLAPGAASLGKLECLWLFVSESFPLQTNNLM